jgi:phospholipid-binding lipoprotein MlaA
MSVHHGLCCRPDTIRGAGSKPVISRASRPARTSPLVFEEMPVASLSRNACHDVDRPGRARDEPPQRRWRSFSVSLVGLLLLAHCAQAPSDPEARADYMQRNDPAEPTNRVIFAGNQFVDRNALRPVARGYQTYVPPPVRGGIHNFTSNLSEPSIALNDMLQGNLSRSWVTTQRFVINTTVGGAGLFDVATGWNRPGHDADFGETLGVWGVGTGPSVQLPLFGPSNVRDSIGKVAGLLTNPATYVSAGAVVIVNAVDNGLSVVDNRARLLSASDTLEHNSVDYYAALRSIAAQHRQALVEDGKRGTVAGAGKQRHEASLAAAAP